MPDEGQVTTTNQGTTTTDTTTTQSLGWRAALPDEYKEHEFVKTFQKPGDFVRSALEIKTEKDALAKKLEGAIFKPGDKATPEEISSYKKAMGIPEKSTEYEFPKDAGVDHDEKMVSWAQGVFHEAGLSKPQAALIAQKWNGFIKGMVDAEEKMAQDTKTTNEKTFREQFKSDAEHKTGMELAKRFWKKITNTDFDEVYKETEAWQVPLFMNFVFNTAKAVGEDWSPKGGTGSTGETRVGIVYDKTDFSKYK